MLRLSPALIPSAIFLLGLFMMVANADMNPTKWALVAAEAFCGTLGLWMLCGART